MSTTVQSPFSLITEPTAVRRILLAEGLLDLANEIVGDGFAFVPIECPEYWGLVIAEKAVDGTVSHRVITAHKRVGAKLMAECFAEAMELCANRKGLPLYAKLQSTNQN